jgi:DNA-directed RNA polymerase subunit RPC12/RpoP
MNMKVICSNCGRETTNDVLGNIRLMLECVEKDMTYGWFMCPECAEANDVLGGNDESDYS